MAISMLKIRRPLGRLIFNMGIAIPGKTVFLIETAPWSGDWQKYQNCWSCKSIACLNSRNQCNAHKSLAVQQDLQMIHLPVHPLYCQRRTWKFHRNWIIVAWWRHVLLSNCRSVNGLVPAVFYTNGHPLVKSNLIRPSDKLSWQPGCPVLNINIQGNFCISQRNGSPDNCQKT